MKKTIKILLAGVLVMGGTLAGYAQIVLPELIIHGQNYKYLNATDYRESTQPVAMLERYAAAYDPRDTDYYEEDFDNYFVSFFIPEGKILAVYDKDGNMIRTAEKYKNVDVPKAVKNAVAKKYPKWAITKSIYVVTYHDETGITKRYKLILENGEHRLRVKVDDEGEFF